MKYSRPLKFGIGLFAGLCASLFPRLVAELTTPDSNGTLVLFSTNYLLLSFVFALFIAIVITILEWETKNSPKDIFMSALAVPAVLSGALNTTATVGDIKQLQNENSSYIQYIENTEKIETLPPTSLTPITYNGLKEKSGFSFSLVQEAYAATANAAPMRTYNLGVQRQSQYRVILGQANSKEEAERMAAQLEQKTPVSIFRNSNGTYVITSQGVKQNKGAALNEALRLKQKGLSPSLQQIR